MNYDEKVKYFIDDMGRRGIGKWTAAPLLYRLLWKLGLKVPPPVFNKPMARLLTFVTCVIFIGLLLTQESAAELRRTCPPPSPYEPSISSKYYHQIL